MQEKINATLLKSDKVKSQDKAFEINDTELKGFLLRVQPLWTDKTGTVHEGTKTYIFRYRVPGGKQNRITIGKHTDYTPAQAREKADALRRQWKEGINLKPEKQANGADPAAEQKVHTLRTFYEDIFKPWAESHLKAYKATFCHFVHFEYMADTPLTEFTGAMFEDWKTKRLSAEIKNSTVNRNISMIHSVFSHALNRELIEKHPLAKVKKLKEDPTPIVRYLDDLEEAHLMKALDDREEEIRSSRERHNAWRTDRGYEPYPDLRCIYFADHLKPMIILSLNTGIRWGELTKLTWQDVNLQNRMLSIKGPNTKSGKTRHVALNSVSVDSMKKWQKQQATSTLVFPGKEGKPIDNLDKSYAKILAAANIAQFRWHDLRHTFASRLVMAGVDLNTVRELMGHSDLKMTLRYAHLAPQHKADAVALLVKKPSQAGS